MAEREKKKAMSKEVGRLRVGRLVLVRGHRADEVGVGWAALKLGCLGQGQELLFAAGLLNATCVQPGVCLHVCCCRGKAELRQQRGCSSLSSGLHV